VAPPHDSSGSTLSKEEIMSVRCSSGSLLTVLVATVLSACSSETAGPGNDSSALTVYGSGSAIAGAPMSSDAPDGALWGPASSVTIHLYALWISTSANCSNPILVQQHPAAGVDKDFMQNPVLFQGSPANGSYQCVMFKMSDVLRMKPATSFGACVAGVEYAGDIYREGETDWKDVDLNPVIGTGSDEAPVDDHVTIFMTRSPAAAIARGISENQVVELGSNLIVPGQSTFVMDASQAVLSWGTGCGLEKPAISFR
jgi:hypothetical protein